MCYWAASRLIDVVVLEEKDGRQLRGCAEGMEQLASCGLLADEDDQSMRSSGLSRRCRSDAESDCSVYCVQVSLRRLGTFVHNS